MNLVCPWLELIENPAGLLEQTKMHLQVIELQYDTIQAEWRETIIHFVRKVQNISIYKSRFSHCLDFKCFKDDFKYVKINMEKQKSLWKVTLRLKLSLGMRCLCRI